MLLLRDRSQKIISFPGPGARRRPRPSSPIESAVHGLGEKRYVLVRAWVRVCVRVVFVCWLVLRGGVGGAYIDLYNH